MGTGAIIALLIGSIVASLAGAGAGVYAGAKNYQAQQEANQTNLLLNEQANSANYDIAKLNNETQLDIAKNAHQYEMADLKAAGLNPVLTATGGQGAHIGSLNTPVMQAGRVQAPQLDLSGLSSALNSMSHMMMMSMIMDGRMKMNNERVDAYNQRTGMMENRSASRLIKLGSQAASRSAINSASQLSSAKNAISAKKWNKLIDEIERLHGLRKH